MKLETKQLSNELFDALISDYEQSVIFNHVGGDLLHVLLYMLDYSPLRIPAGGKFLQSLSTGKYLLGFMLYEGRLSEP